MKSRANIVEIPFLVVEISLYDTNYWSRRVGKPIFYVLSNEAPDQEPKLRLSSIHNQATTKMLQMILVAIQDRE